MALKFGPISISMQADYRERLEKSGFVCSDYSFINLWGWAEEYGLEWAWSDPLTWIRQTRPSLLYWAPVGAMEGVDWKDIFKRHVPKGSRFMRIPADLAHLWEAIFKGGITLGDSREHWDYLYNREELVALSGRRFHKKKNLLNQFRKKYDTQYLPMGPDLIEHALGMQENWCTWRDCESSEALAAENRAIPRILERWDDLLEISGGAIFSGGEMIAYTLAERLTSQTLLIHFEKGDHEYKGVYQAINHAYLKHQEDNAVWVNREQDLGDPGLRKAKLSYHPVELIEKFTVELN